MDDKSTKKELWVDINGNVKEQVDLDGPLDVEMELAAEVKNLNASLDVQRINEITENLDHSRVNEDHVRKAGESQQEHHHHHHHHHHKEKLICGKKRNSAAVKKPKSSKKKRKKNPWKVILIVLLILLVATGAVGMYVYNEYKSAMNGEKVEPKYTDAELGIDPRVAEELDGYRLITIYGLDNTKRSDVILVIAIDKETKNGKIFTVYRDTYMQLNPDKAYTIANKERDFFKCNHAYKKGKMITSIKMLNRHLDLNIREALGMNWDAVASMVESLGGIEVTMSQDLADFINRGRSEENKIILNDGVAKLNGEQAVAYLRTRKDPGSNAVTRSNRNLIVFLDLFERAKRMNKEEVLDIFTHTIGKCETNMRMQEMIALLKDIRSYELYPANGWPYTYDILWDDSYYYYVPVTLETNVYQLHANLFDQLGYEPTETCKSLSKQIKEKKKSLF